MPAVIELRYSPQSRNGYGAELLLSQFPRENARRIRAASGTRNTIPVPGHEPLGDGALYEGHNWDDVKPHLWNFFQSVKSRKPAVEDAVFGNHAALACHMANESYFRKKPVFLDADAPIKARIASTSSRQLNCPGTCLCEAYRIRRLGCNLQGLHRI